MLHSKQWHYSLHRDFQNCYSTRRSPTGFFSSNSSSNSTRVPIQHTSSIHHPHLHVHTTSTSREFSIQKYNSTCRRQRALRVLLLHYRFQKRNSMHRRQGDLLEMHPCVLQDLPMTFQAFQPQDLPRHSSYSSYSSYSSCSRDIPDIPVIHDLPAFPGNSTSSSISRDSTPFQHSPIRMHIVQFLQFDWFPQKTPPSTS